MKYLIAKARTIVKYLGKGYRVEASIGHVRDLPQGAKHVPAQYKGEPWANLGVNVVVSVATTTPGNAWMRSSTVRKKRCFSAAVVY